MRISSISKQQSDNSDAAKAAMPIRFEDCKAKTCEDGSAGTGVFDHCRYAGMVANGLWSCMPSSVQELLGRHVGFLASLHDIGKVSLDFQAKYFSDELAKHGMDEAYLRQCVGNVGHAQLGARSFEMMTGPFEGDAMACVIGGHHGAFSGTLNVPCPDDCWQSERIRLRDSLAKYFGCEWIVCKDAVKGKNLISLLTGLTCVADWLSSDENNFPPSERSLDDAELRRRVEKIISDAGFSSSAVKPGLSFKDVFGFDMNDTQKRFIDEIALDRSGVYVLEAPMGVGKTEAALYAAYKLIGSGVNSGLYFALPTRLTSDKIHDRVGKFLATVCGIEQSAVKLAHGQAWLREYEIGSVDEYSDNGSTIVKRVPSWFNPAKRSLLFPYAVGTIDQALMSVINVKHAFVRTFALAGKVVVLDEVHSYDCYTGTLLDRLVAMLRSVGATVIVLSATLSAKRRRELLGVDVNGGLGYPLISKSMNEKDMREIDAGEVKNRKVRIDFTAKEGGEPVERAVESARTGCNVVMIANTVANAQEWYRKVKCAMREGDEFEVGILHSMFPMFRRSEIEEHWIGKLGKHGNVEERRKGSILVATQIVEQSVDIDADYMISELAPVDMVLQRAGRLWRHERAERSCKEARLTLVTEMVPALPCAAEDERSVKKWMSDFFGKSCYVYAPYVLLRTYEELQNIDDIEIPGGIRALIEAVYRDDAEVRATKAHEALWGILVREKETLENLASQAQSKNLPTGSDDESRARTRCNNHPSVPVLIVKDVDEGAEKFYVAMTLLDGTRVRFPTSRIDFGALRQFHKNLVRVKMNKWIGSWIKRGDGQYEMLSKYFHRGEMPILCRVAEDGMKLIEYFSDEAIGWSYDRDIGIVKQKEDAVSSGYDSVADEEDNDCFLGEW